METKTRAQVIDDLRHSLRELVDEDHSICDVAARTGIFCGGFARFTFTELRARFPQIVRSRPRITPKELRELANRWQVVRRDLAGAPLACDVMAGERGPHLCQGWDEFSDEELARFHEQICGEPVEVVAAPTRAGT